jgi:hypothetical protein
MTAAAASPGISRAEGIFDRGGAPVDVIAVANRLEVDNLQPQSDVTVLPGRSYRKHPDGHKSR